MVNHKTLTVHVRAKQLAEWIDANDIHCEGSRYYCVGCGASTELGNALKHKYNCRLIAYREAMDEAKRCQKS